MEEEIDIYQKECDVCGRREKVVDDSFWEGTKEHKCPLRCENGCSIICNCGNVCDGVGLGCVKIKNFEHLINYAWIFDIICGKCNCNIRLDYCVICKERSWEELCCKCSNKVAKGMISCLWNDCNCHSFIEMRDFTLKNELYAVAMLNINKKDGWFVTCHDHDAFHGEAFIEPPIWNIDMCDENWIWDIIAEYLDDIDALYHKMYLVDEIVRFSMVYDVKFLINHQMVNRTLMEIVGVGC